MGPFGLPWSTAAYFIFSIIGCPVIMEIILHTKWWKEKSEYYWSFNNQNEKDKKE